MKADGRRTLVLASCAAFLVVGIPYWMKPLSGLSLPRDILGVPLVAVGVIAALACLVGRTGFWKTGLAMSASVPAAVMARVVCEVALDPGTHNLWPFELVLATGPALAAGFTGAAIGSLARRLLP
jgi:ABC-type branched-subunit amino acid transport system permease subunit